MNLCLDNIIFSLQRSGGISVYWYELLKRVMIDPDFHPVFFDTSSNNIFRHDLKILSNHMLENHLAFLPIFIQRYFNPYNTKFSGVFHSSYYRTLNNPRIFNITTVHDFTYEYYRTGIAGLVHHRQKTNAIEHSERIICVSNNTKDDLLRFFPKISNEKVYVIYNGVDDNYKPLQGSNKDQLEQMIKFPSEHYALYVGDRRALYKNFKIAVLGCAKAKIPLVIVGGGLLTKAESSFLDKSLTISKYLKLESLSNQQLNLLYNHALCLLYPSRYEGFGLPVIEAQKAGCLVVCQRYSSIPEIAGEGAIFLEYETSTCVANTLSQISSNPTYFNTIKDRGSKNALRFSWEKCYQQTKQVYKSAYLEFFGK